MCVKCGKELSGRQTRFCSLRCKNTMQVAGHRRSLKLRALEYKGNKCVDCGYSKCVGALSFHHTDNNKEFGIAGAGITRSWEKVKAELDKCVLVCANCHAERHWLVV